MEDYLNVNEKLKYEVIKQVVEGKKSKQISHLNVFVQILIIYHSFQSNS